MTRPRLVALLALACALAALAAGAGPLLVERDQRAVAQPDHRFWRGLRDLQGAKVGRPHGAAHYVDLVVGDLVLVVAVVLLLLAVWHYGRALLRLIRLRFAASAPGVRTAEYDPGEQSDEDAETALRDRVREELVALSADLDAVPDPREAVIACYVRMERALAAAGSPRRATESPMELLARVLAERQVPESDVRRLTALFTEARFSPHPVTEEMRADARRSLRAIADALAVPA